MSIYFIQKNVFKKDFSRFLSSRPRFAGQCDRQSRDLTYFTKINSNTWSFFAKKLSKKLLVIYEKLFFKFKNYLDRAAFFGKQHKTNQLLLQPLLVK